MPKLLTANVLRRALATALLAALVAVAAAPRALAIGCGTEGQEACEISSGSYFVRIPKPSGPRPWPVVLILHDAGQSGAEIVADQVLVDSFVEAGHAVIAPNATKRKYVRGVISRSFVGGGFRDRSQKRRYVLETADGELRGLRPTRDRGWYFYNTDALIQRGKEISLIGPRRSEPRGRDEMAFLAEVLEDAALRFWVNPRQVIVVGFGHGAALAWQMACLTPERARLFAPVNGVYWDRPPRTCQAGGRVLHTHETASRFWPMQGSEFTRRWYGQAPVRATLDKFAAINGCDPDGPRRGPDGPERKTWIWPGCDAGASVELTLLEQPFNLPQWWLEKVLAAPADTTWTEGNPDTGPGTDLGPESMTGSVGPANPRFLRPRYPARN